MVSRQWDRYFWRDARLAGLLLVWVAVTIGLLIYFISPLIFQRTAHEAHRNAVATQRENDELYTGSIVIVPTNGDLCWQRMFDNRTGAFWDNGYTACENVVSQLIEEGRNSTTSFARIHAIADAFRGDEIKSK